MNRYLKWMLEVVLAGFVAGALFALWDNHRPFSKEQRTIIRQSDSVMYVTTWPEDSAILRTPCVDLSRSELKSRDLKKLIAKMLATVRSPQHDGVGIAAPQVGIGKRIVCLQRFDKEGGPFECYLNIHVDSLFGDIGKGPEGCLSVPPMRGLVPRYTSVIVSKLPRFSMLWAIMNGSTGTARNICGRSGKARLPCWIMTVFFSAGYVSAVFPVQQASRTQDSWTGLKRKTPTGS